MSPVENNFRLLPVDSSSRKCSTDEGLSLSLTQARTSYPRLRSSRQMCDARYPFAPVTRTCVRGGVAGERRIGGDGLRWRSKVSEINKSNEGGQCACTGLTVLIDEVVIAKVGNNDSSRAGADLPTLPAISGFAGRWSAQKKVWFSSTFLIFDLASPTTTTGAQPLIRSQKSVPAKTLRPTG